MKHSTPRPPADFTYQRNFQPVVVRNRHDSWTPDRQADFIAALGECGCVADACRVVGMSTESAYRLRGRFDAIDFRRAWEAALDYAVDRLADAALSRALHGVAVPHYYQGEVVGEHRRYDERLTQFILRYRKPLTYARHWDREAVTRGHPEDYAEQFSAGIDAVRRDVSRGRFERATADDLAAGAVQAAAEFEARVDLPEASDEDVEAGFAAAEAWAEARDRYAAEIAAGEAERIAREYRSPTDYRLARRRLDDGSDAGPAVPPDVARPSSTSAAESNGTAGTDHGRDDIPGPADGPSEPHPAAIAGDAPQPGGGHAANSARMAATNASGWSTMT